MKLHPIARRTAMPHYSLSKNKFMENSLDHELLGILPPRFSEVDKIIQDMSERNDQIIRKAFPMKIWITPWALMGPRWDTLDCVGARTLKRALKKLGLENTSVSWGDDEGHFIVNHEKLYIVSTGISMMDQYFPRRVTLRIIN